MIDGKRNKADTEMAVNVLLAVDTNANSAFPLKHLLVLEGSLNDIKVQIVKDDECNARDKARVLLLC